MGASLATGRCVWAQNGWSSHKRCFGAGHLVVNVKVRVWCQEKHYVFKLLTSTEVESWGGGERSRPPLSQIAAPFVTGSNVTGSKVLRAWHSDMHLLETHLHTNPSTVQVQSCIWRCLYIFYTFPFSLPTVLLIHWMTTDKWLIFEWLRSHSCHEFKLRLVFPSAVLWGLYCYSI